MALVVFTGGARSGKSHAAQNLARARALDGASVAVVVFALVGDDAEMADRVARHQTARPAEFRLIEASDSRAWLAELESESLLLVDCLGTLVGLIMAEEWRAAVGAADASAATQFGLESAGADLPPGYADAVEERADAIVSALCARAGDTIVVTNEVGDGVVPAHASGRLFRDVLGRANRALASRADRAYLTVCGRLLDLSAMPTTPQWPED